MSSSFDINSFKSVWFFSYSSKHSEYSLVNSLILFITSNSLSKETLPLVIIGSPLESFLAHSLNIEIRLVSNSLYFSV